MIDVIKAIDPGTLAIVVLYILIRDVLVPLIKRVTNKTNPGALERIAALEKGQEAIEDRLDKIEDKLFK